MTKIKIRIEKEGQTTPAKEFLIDVGNEGEYILKIPSNGDETPSAENGTPSAENGKIEIKTTRNDATDKSFIDLIAKQAEDKKAEGSNRTFETYSAAARSLKSFRDDILISEMTPQLMKRYEKFLLDKGLMRNSIGFYMRVLKAVYNRGIKTGAIAVDLHPFSEVYSGKEPVKKPAVTQETIYKILEYKPRRKSTALAQDLFLFSFYTRGMSFVDMGYLKKTDLRDGNLRYRSRHTGQMTEVKWEPCMQEIVNKYISKTAQKYMLPIILKEGNEDEERKQLRNMQLKMNRSLKTISKAIGLEKPVSMFMTRGSWSAIANTVNAGLIMLKAQAQSERGGEFFGKSKALPQAQTKSLQCEPVRLD